MTIECLRVARRVVGDEDAAARLPTGQVSGLPAEVVLWIYGRDDVADVLVTKVV